MIQGICRNHFRHLIDFKLTQTYSQIIPRKLVFSFLEIMSHEFIVEMSGNGTLGDNLSEAHILRIIVWVLRTRSYDLTVYV